MSENNDRSLMPVILGAFAVGALMGAGLALLYAPQSGQETRELVCKKTQALKEAALAALNKVKQKAGAVADKGKEVADEMSDMASGTV